MDDCGLFTLIVLCTFISHKCTNWWPSSLACEITRVLLWQKVCYETGSSAYRVYLVQLKGDSAVSRRPYWYDHTHPFTLV